jgi:CarD family transcriptional regulator
MFQVGDKVLYPLYGAGVIHSIEEKEFFGVNRSYYHLKIPHVNMEIMIPVGRADDFGIREVVNPEIIEDVLQGFYQGETDPIMFDSNNRFYREINRKKIKSGDIYKGGEIIRDLVRKSKHHKLGTEDTNMLNNARQILTSEIMQSKGIELEQAIQLLNRVIFS